MATILVKCYQRHGRFLRRLHQRNARAFERVFSGDTFYKNSGPDSDDPNDPNVAKKNEQPHVESPTKHNIDLFSAEPLKGKIYDKFPFRMKLEAGKSYAFCTCGYSKQQPFCDSSHKAPHLTSTRPMHVKYRPIRFKVEETKEYWLCQCKQSNNRPFCDGSHKKQEVQDAIR